MVGEFHRLELPFYTDLLEGRARPPGARPRTRLVGGRWWVSVPPAWLAGSDPAPGGETS